MNSKRDRHLEQMRDWRRRGSPPRIAPERFAHHFTKLTPDFAGQMSRRWGGSRAGWNRKFRNLKGGQAVNSKAGHELATELGMYLND